MNLWNYKHPERTQDWGQLKSLGLEVWCSTKLAEAVKIDVHMYTFITWNRGSIWRYLSKAFDLRNFQKTIVNHSQGPHYYDQLAIKTTFCQTQGWNFTLYFSWKVQETKPVIMKMTLDIGKLVKPAMNCNDNTWTFVTVCTKFHDYTHVEGCYLVQGLCSRPSLYTSLYSFLTARSIGLLIYIWLLSVKSPDLFYISQTMYKPGK